MEADAGSASCDARPTARDADVRSSAATVPARGATVRRPSSAALLRQSATAAATTANGTATGAHAATYDAASRTRYATDARPTSARPAAHAGPTAIRSAAVGSAYDASSRTAVAGIARDAVSSHARHAWLRTSLSHATTATVVDRLRCARSASRPTTAIATAVIAIQPAKDTGSVEPVFTGIATRHLDTRSRLNASAIVAAYATFSCGLESSTVFAGRFQQLTGDRAAHDALAVRVVPDAARG